MTDLYFLFSEYYDSITLASSNLSRAFVIELAKRENLQTICDFGCGTGSLLLDFAMISGSGYGCDKSLAMCEKAIEKLNGFKKVQIHNSDMLDFSPPQPVNLATCMFDTLNYLLTQHSWESFFKHVYSTLRPGGFFIFDFVTEYDIKKCWAGFIGSHQGDEWSVKRVCDYDSKREIGIEKMIWRYRKNGIWKEFVEIHEHFTMSESAIQKILLNYGFIDITFKDADTLGSPYLEETTRILTTARKGKGA
jgi:SAM-dependent methyltransferase